MGVAGLLTTHTEDGTLSGCQKVHGARLKRIIRVEHLLCHVETVVVVDGSAVGWSLCHWWWRGESAALSQVGNDGSLQCCPVH